MADVEGSTVRYTHFCSLSSICVAADLLRLYVVGSVCFQGKIVVNGSFVVDSCLGFYREIAKAKYGSMNLLPSLLGFLDSLDYMLDRNGDEPPRNVCVGGKD